MQAALDHHPLPPGGAQAALLDAAAAVENLTATQLQSASNWKESIRLTQRELYPEERCVCCHSFGGSSDLEEGGLLCSRCSHMWQAYEDGEDQRGPDLQMLRRELINGTLLGPFEWP